MRTRKPQSLLKVMDDHKDNLIKKLVEYCDEICEIIEYRESDLLFGIRISKLEEKIDELRGTVTKPEYKHTLIAQVISIYRYYNEGCEIKLI